jgi:membrane-associated phospholipid phosphatase
MSSAVIPSADVTRAALPIRAHRALLGAGLLSFVLFACWFGAFHSVALAQADAHAYLAFYSISLGHPGLAHLAQRVADLCLPTPYTYLAAVPVIVALARRRWALAVGLLVMMPAAVETSELLKPLLAAPRPALGVSNTPLSAQGSWPSGHSTAAMILAMACLLASPARWRPYVAVAGTLFSLAVIYSVLSLGWHYPTDALGGILVALIWTLLTVAAVLRVDSRYGRDLSLLGAEPGRWLSPGPSLPGLVALAAVPVAGVLVLRGPQAFSFAGHHRAFLVALAAVALLAAFALALMTLTVTLSGSDPAARAARRVRLPRG